MTSTFYYFTSRFIILFLIFVNVWKIVYSYHRLNKILLKKNYNSGLGSEYNILHFFKLYAKDKKEYMENGVNLLKLDNFEVDGSFLQDAVTQWLDSEYITQKIHKKLGDKVKNIYIDSRQKGVVDLGEMLLEVGTSLESFDMEDSFVNSWDVANKVSDLLMVRLDRELCECSGDMNQFIDISKKIENKIIVSAEVFDENITIENLDIDVFRKCQKFYSSEFERFKLLRDIAEGEVTWREISPVIAMVLGYRLVPVAGGLTYRLERNRSLGPYRWEKFNNFPDFLDTNQRNLEIKMVEDLPENEDGTDVVIESLVGVETYKQMKSKVDDLLLQRRIILCKWLYIHGFLTSDFPLEKQYIPAHLLDEDY